MFDASIVPTITLPNGATVFPAMEQGTPEWLAARAGIPTASRFKDILTKPREKGAEWSKTALTYAYEVAGEILTGQPTESFTSKATERGKMLEPEVRAQYEFIADAEVVEVGFARRGRAGASPDGLVGDDGAVEIKTHLPKIIIPMIVAGELPDEHEAQTKGLLWITGRDWVDLVAYWPGLPLFTHRVYRDLAFEEALEQRIGAFNYLVDDLVNRVRAYGDPALAIAAE